MRASTCIFLVGLWACGSYMPEVRHRAAFDLTCPEAEVTVQQVSEATGSETYGARGCGKQATYLIGPSVPGHLVLNSPVTPTDTSGPPSK